MDSPNSAGSLPTVTGVVTRVYSGMYSNIDAHVEASVTLERNGENISSTNCNGTIVAPAGTISASEYEAVFTATMDQFITDCIPRLIAMDSNGVTQDHTGIVHQYINSFGFRGKLFYKTVKGIAIAKICLPCLED